MLYAMGTYILALLVIVFRRSAPIPPDSSKYILDIGKGRRTFKYRNPPSGPDPHPDKPSLGLLVVDMTEVKLDPFPIHFHNSMSRSSRPSMSCHVQSRVQASRSPVPRLVLRNSRTNQSTLPVADLAISWGKA
jgi:hypothetical protein